MSQAYHWQFKSRFRANAYGWAATRLATKRLKEAVSEIKKVARSEPVLAADGAVALMERLWPALEGVDGSSGALGAAVNRTLDTLVPLVIAAPADPQTRAQWTERLYQAVCDDGVDYLAPVQDRWGELCGSRDLAAHWVDRMVPFVQEAWASNEPGAWVLGATLCLSCLLETGRFEELQGLLSLRTHRFWHFEKFAAEALARQGRVDDAIAHAEACRGDRYDDRQIFRFCERVLLASKRTDEAYRQYGLAEAIGEHIARLDSHNEYRVYAKEFDSIFVVAAAGDREVQEMLGKHRDVVRRLRRGLANALRSAEKRWWRGDQLRGELSSRALHRLCLDRPQLDVFRTQGIVQGRSTAVSIVLDASGSMTTNKMDVARDALRVLLQALEEFKVATEAITFTTGNDTNVFKQAAERGEDPNLLRQRFSRIANLEIGVVKQFEESVKTAMCRLPSIKGTGLTPLGEAMQIAARRLLPRRETRKIMLVLTDGRAGCESNDGSAVKHAEHVAKRIESAGMELIGVGILDESLRAIVADTIVVHQLEDLPAQLCKLLSRTLKNGLKHVG